MGHKQAWPLWKIETNKTERSAVQWLLSVANDRKRQLQAALVVYSWLLEQLLLDLRGQKAYLKGILVQLLCDFGRKLIYHMTYQFSELTFLLHFLCIIIQLFCKLCTRNFGNTGTSKRRLKVFIQWAFFYKKNSSWKKIFVINDH